MSEPALKQLPNDEDILLLKAKAQEQNTNNPVKALTTVKAILDKNPENQKAKDLKNNLSRSLSMNTIGVFGFRRFLFGSFRPYGLLQSEIFAPDQTTEVLPAKLNFNRKFNTNGLQQFE